jgi:hypothetical protein
VARSLPSLIACAALLWLAPAAGAHSLIRISGGLASYISVDAVSLNTLTVRPSGANIEFRDPTAYQGTDAGNPCTPGEVNGAGELLQAFCPAASISQVRIDLGDREDTAVVAPGVPSTVLGGEGADALTMGDAADSVDGGGGNDRIAAGGGGDIVDAGLGVDDIDAGPGDDDIRVRDGEADTVRCGDGGDRVAADGADTVAGDCEAVSRTATAPPAGSGTTATDKRPPVVDVSAVTMQRLGRRGVVRVVGTSSERGTLGASGYIDIAGLRRPLGNVSRRITAPGGGAELALKLSRSLVREAKRALRRKRRVTVYLSVVATDAAGNSAPKRAPRIRIRA